MPHYRETRNHLAIPNPTMVAGPKTYIEASAEQATKKHQEQIANTQDYLYVYTDGSGKLELEQFQDFGLSFYHSNSSCRPVRISYWS